MAQSARPSQVDDRRLAAARRRVDDQEAKLRHLIVNGAPTQAAEDQLCRLKDALEAMRSGPALLSPKP